LIFLFNFVILGNANKKVIKLKKYFLLVFTIVLVFIFCSNNMENTALVFNENEYINNYDNEYFYITSKKIQLNTNNFSNYFNDSDIKIIGVYPSLTKIYNDKIKQKISYYGFNTLYSIKVNINNFTNKYVSVLKNNNYIEEANMVYFDGVNIDKVLVYAPYNSIYFHSSNYGIFEYNIKEF